MITLPRLRSITASRFRVCQTLRRSCTDSSARGLISTIESSAMRSIALEPLPVRISLASWKSTVSPAFSGTVPSSSTWNSSPSTASMWISPPVFRVNTSVCTLRPTRPMTITAAAAKRQVQVDNTLV